MKYPEVRNYLGGSFVGADRPFLEVFNPSDGSVISRVPLSTQVDVDAAVASAAKAQPAWAAMPIKERVQVFYRYKTLLEQNIDDRLKSIVARNTELAQLSKQFEAGADDANASAASIRFERVKKTLDVLNTGVATLKDLRSTLKTGSDKQLIASIDKAMAATQTVRNLLEKA